MKEQSIVKKLVDDEGNDRAKKLHHYGIKSPTKRNYRPEDYNYLVPWMQKDEQINFKNEK